MSILDNTAGIVEQWLDIEAVGTTSPHYAHKESLRICSDRASLVPNPALIDELLNVLHRNWAPTRRHGSPANWQWRQRTDFRHAASQLPETILERRFIASVKQGWANQIPTSSGLVDSAADKKRNLDLMHKPADGHYTFYELKVENKHPLYAAIEIFLNSVIYLFSRAHAQEIGYSPVARPVLGAQVIGLRVLAPISYYSSYNTRLLEQVLCTQLKTFCRERYGRKLNMDFAFESFPPHFEWAKYTRWSAELSAAEKQELVEEFAGRQRVNPPQ